MSVLGILLTIVWFCNNCKVRAYVNHWRESLKKIEKEAGLTQKEFAFVTQQKVDGCPSYHFLQQAVPVLFLIAWVWLLLTCAYPRLR